MKLASADESSRAERAEVAKPATSRRDTIARPRAAKRESSRSDERAVALPTFNESELKADEAPRDETRRGPAVYLSAEEGPHGELCRESVAESRDDA
jgi:hypothetical protein